MGIRKIDYDLCKGCRTCVNICPMDVLRIDETTQKPVIKYLSDCQSCFLCERDCPEGAIYVTPFRERRIPLPW
jgi:NAD-dependent dihydropyrimidine dehydrogenase PreA subunit